MGWYLKKSIRVGILRFNLSKSGIGVSTGIPGLRVGIGPRGTYIHMGHGGLYYRKTLVPPGRWSSPSDDYQALNESSSNQPDTHGEMEEMGSGCVSKMVDSSSTELLAEIEQKRNRSLLWSKAFILMVLVAAVAILLRTIDKISIWTAIAPVTISVAVTVAAYFYDQLRKSVVIMYDLDGPCLDAYKGVVSAVESLARCGAVWQVTARGKVLDPRYHAGADNIIRRRRLSIKSGDPPNIKVNVSVPYLKLEKHSLYLLPDKVLVFAENGVGVLNYQDLKFSINTTIQIEDGAVPHDAKVVGQTWRYVNKDGSPDRRFSRNRRIPKCQYEVLLIAGEGGFREILQLSLQGASERFTTAIASAVEGINKAIIAEQERSGKNLEQHSREQSTEENQLEVVLPTGGRVRPNPTAEDLQFALFDVLCCIVLVDSTITANEKNMLCGIMGKVSSSWTPDLVERRLSLFSSNVQEFGFKTVLNCTVQQLPMFKKAGRAKVLLNCLDLITSADSETAKRTLAFRDQIRQLLSADSSEGK